MILCFKAQVWEGRVAKTVIPFSPSPIIPCFLGLLGLKSPMRNRWNILAFTVLGLVFAGMSVYLIVHPDRTGVVPNYRNASTHWWASQNIYESGTHGFLYVPTFAVLFTPFNLIQPAVLGEILWRLFGFALFGWALWMLARVLNTQHGRLGITAPTFMYIVLLAVPASLASLNNGQTNLSLSAVLVLAALALRDEKWSVAALLLTAALILKPIALAPCLLAFAVFSPVRGYLLGGMIGAVALGFLHPDLTYAWHQTVGFGHKLFDSYTPENLRVSDLFGIFQKANVPTPFRVDTITRGLASLAALWFCWWKYRRGHIPKASWALWVGSCIILTVFNPRAETNSYVLISPLLAYVACGHLLDPQGNKIAGWMLGLACIGLMCDGMGKTIYLATDVWLKPLIVLVVSPLLFRAPDSWRPEKIER